MRRMNKSSSAFTLIEILIVIAIILLLLGIVFASVSSARKKATQTGCLSNQRQIGMALKMYCSDYDGTFPENNPFLYSIFKIPDLRCPTLNQNKNKLNGYGYNVIIGSQVRSISESGLEWPSLTIVFTEVGDCEYVGMANVRNYICERTPISYLSDGSASRHSGGSNYQFADGHVKWHTYDQVDRGIDSDGTLYSDGSLPTFAPWGRPKP